MTCVATRLCTCSPPISSTASLAAGASQSTSTADEAPASGFFRFFTMAGERTVRLEVPIGCPAVLSALMRANNVCFRYICIVHAVHMCTFCSALDSFVQCRTGTYLKIQGNVCIQLLVQCRTHEWKKEKKNFPTSNAVHLTI